MMLEAVVADDLSGDAPALLQVRAQDVEAFAEEFAAYHARFAPFFARREQRADPAHARSRRRARSLSVAASSVRCASTTATISTAPARCR